MKFGALARNSSFVKEHASLPVIYKYIIILDTFQKKKLYFTRNKIIFFDEFTISFSKHKIFHDNNNATPPIHIFIPMVDAKFDHIYSSTKMIETIVVRIRYVHALKEEMVSSLFLFIIETIFIYNKNR